MADIHNGNSDALWAGAGVTMVALVFVGLYRLWLTLVAGVRRVKRVVHRLLAFFLDVASYIGLAILGLLVSLVVLDLLILAARPLFRAWARSGSCAMASLPRYEVVTQDASPSGPIERALATPVAEFIHDLYPRGIRISRAEFSTLRTQALKQLRRRDSAFMRSLVVEPLLTRLLQQDPAVTRLVEQHAKGHKHRRPMFITLRFLYAVSGGRMGWAESQSWSRPNLDELLSDPRAFGRYIESIMYGALRPIEIILAGEEAQVSAPSLPDASNELHQQPGPTTPPDTSTPAELVEHEEVAPPPTPVDDDSLPEEAGETPQLAAGVLAEIEHQLLEDGPGWNKPGDHLDRLAASLLEISRDFEPESLVQLADRLEEARRRLPDFEQWLDLQLCEQFDPALWSPSLSSAVLEADETGDLSMNSVRRHAVRRFTVDEIEQLAPAVPISSVSSEATGVDSSDQKPERQAVASTLPFDSGQQHVAEQLF